MNVWEVSLYWTLLYCIVSVFHPLFHYPAVVSSDICLPQPLWMTLPALKRELNPFYFVFLICFNRWAKASYVWFSVGGLCLLVCWVVHAPFLNFFISVIDLYMHNYCCYVVVFHCFQERKKGRSSWQMHCTFYDTW